MFAQLAPAADGLEAENRHQHRADDQDDRLQGFGVGDGPHAAEHRVQARQQHHEHRADPEAVERRSEPIWTFRSGSSVAETMPPA